MNVFWLMVQALASIPMLPRDIGFGIGYWKTNRQIGKWDSKGWAIHQVFDQIAKENPQKIAIRIEEEAWTFRELQEFSLRVANFFHSNGYKEGDVVALLMENHPRYVATWLGLSRIGVITALLNTGVKGDTLIQAVTTATKKPCRAFICGINFLPVLDSVQQSKDKLPDDMKLYLLGGNVPSDSFSGLEHLDPLLEPEVDQPSLLTPIDQTISKTINMSTKMVYVYTSGTEGYPKAATFNFRRFMFMATASHILLGVRKSDILYTPMPLYHASGGLLGTGQMMLFGTTMVITPKFSATAYFPDCKRYGVTVGQYIGEMCSYIYSKRPAPTDKEHHVRMMFGNGMRTTLWKDFQKRFNVKKIGEFYGSTEGNTNMVNTNNKVGAVGFMPWYAKFIYPVDLLQYDPAEGKPLCDPNGLCKQARKRGLLVGGVKDTPSSRFEGYADEKATNSKMLRNVFKKGDVYFNSGDILERDIFGYYYFVDRLGDTFRWKGENIAASQVESIIVKNMNLDPGKVAVYGVKVEGQEGRAGMAAFAMNDAEMNKEQLLKVAKQHMFAQQVPVFLRITKDLPMTTGTEKIKKAELKTQGWNPKDIVGVKGTDKLYYYSVKTKKYEPLTQEIHDAIINKTIPI